MEFQKECFQLDQVQFQLYLEAQAEADLVQLVSLYSGYRKFLDKSMNHMKSNSMSQSLDQLEANIEEICSSTFKVLAIDLPDYDMKMLKLLSDQLINKYPNLIMLLGGRSQDKGIFVVKLPLDLIESLGHARDVMNQITAVVGGNGGGRPEFVTAGGADGVKLMDGLNLGKAYICEKLSG